MLNTCNIENSIKFIMAMSRNTANGYGDNGATDTAELILIFSSSFLTRFDLWGDSQALCVGNCKFIKKRKEIETLTWAYGILVCNYAIVFDGQKFVGACW